MENKLLAKVNNLFSSTISYKVTNRTISYGKYSESFISTQVFLST
jgi:hypothetical protein